MKILGFKGDESRGKEIKDILERLGGYDVSGLYFAEKDIIYYIIPNLNRIGCNYISRINKDDFVIFTIDEFKEKFIFNVGDLVRLGEYGKIDTVTKMKWDDTLGEVMYEINGDWYRDYECVVPSCEVEKKLMTQRFTKSTRLIDNLDIVEVRDNEVEIVLDYRDSVALKNGRISIIRTSKYPNSYEECCKVLCCEPVIGFDGLNYDEENLYKNFIILKRCRDAYWKIAGEQMGLEKPWEPDLENEYLYCIYNYWGEIIKDKTTPAFNKILNFPTEEMRDTFYENFQDLIEACKELL